jgi:hypothetical protein
VREGKLFAMMTDGFDGVVIDLKSGEVESVIPKISGQQVVSQKSPYDHKVYLNADGKLFSYDLKTKAAQPAMESAVEGIVGMQWIKSGDAQVLAVLTKRALFHFDPRTGEHKRIDYKIPPEPTPIQSIARGPDGKIYCGGYLVGGLSAFDPKTDKHEQLGRISQPESIGVMRRKLYLGLYPQARLMEYDPAQPWEARNPRQFESLDRFDQDRPFATLGIDKLNKVFFGTVPDYGTLGGALSIYDVATDKVSSYRGVVKDQGIVTLAYAHGYVIGGTTISGGLGIEPKAKFAKLFMWNPLNNQKEFETAPLADAWLISGLTTSPDNKQVWGVADSTLFVFDVPSRKIISTTKLFQGKSEGSKLHRWRDAFLAFHRDGQIYGTMGNKLFRVDPKTKHVEILRDKDAVLLALDDAGRVYFRDRTNLWRFTP